MVEYHYPTPSDVAAMTTEAEDAGSSGFYFADNQVDWERLLDDLERGHRVDLGNDAESWAIRRIKAAYARGRRSR